MEHCASTDLSSADTASSNQPPPRQAKALAIGPRLALAAGDLVGIAIGEFSGPPPIRTPRPPQPTLAVSSLASGAAALSACVAWAEAMGFLDREARIDLGIAVLEPICMPRASSRTTSGGRPHAVIIMSPASRGNQVGINTARCSPCRSRIPDDADGFALGRANETSSTARTVLRLLKDRRGP